MRAVLALAAMVRIASADDTVDEVHDGYRWQVAVNDTVAIGLAAFGTFFAVKADNGVKLGFEIAGVGVAAYALGGPAIHYLHGQVERSLFSVGGRVLLPLAVGLFAGEDNKNDAKWGVLVGACIASVLDISVNSGSYRVQIWRPTPNGTAIGLAGSF